MKKVLKIRFVKFNIALAVQVLEMTGQFLDSANVKIGNTRINARFLPYANCVRFSKDNLVDIRYFSTNKRRDEFLSNVVKWISEQHFTTDRKLEIGEECLFSDNEIEWTSGRYAGKCAKQLGEPRFLRVEGDVLSRWEHVKPTYGALKVEGDIYTWELDAK